MRFADPAISYVDDAEIATRFYIEHFGFVETFRTPKQGKPDHVEFIPGLASKKAARTMHRLPLAAGGSPRAEVGDRPGRQSRSNCGATIHTLRVTSG